jgi:hypothetical protein
MSERYKFEAPGCGVIFEADRLRRDRHELIGELTVRCDLPGVRSINGCLSVGDFNFSSVRARQERAKLLTERAQTNGDVDWFGLLEDFCQKIFASERAGQPAIDLRELPGRNVMTKSALMASRFPAGIRASCLVMAALRSPTPGFTSRANLPNAALL